jgi:uncharacterized protein YjbJ (UPF0337 family)
MDENRMDGAARDLGGRIQEAAGTLVGDTATQVNGQVNRLAGQAQNAYGQAVDEVKTFTTEQPLTALLAALGVGAVLGFMIRRI